MSENLDPRAQVEQHTLEVLERLYDNGPRMLDVVKMRVVYWERLVIVDAGALALSLTAAGFFRNHIYGDGGAGYLLAAWKFLIASIICSIVAQWAAANNSVYLNRRLTSMVTSYDVLRLERRMREADFLVPEATKSFRNALESDTNKAQKWQRGFELLSQLLGGLSQVSTVIAFIWLYQFASVNLKHLA